MKTFLMTVAAVLVSANAFATDYSSFSVTIGDGEPFVVDTGVSSGDFLSGAAGSPEDRAKAIIDDLVANDINVEHVVVDASLDDVLSGQLDDTIGQDSAIDFATDEAMNAYEDRIDAALETEQANSEIDDAYAASNAADHGISREQFEADYNASK